MRILVTRHVRRASSLTASLALTLVLGAAAVFPVSAQSLLPAGQPPLRLRQTSAAPATTVQGGTIQAETVETRRLTVDDAVRLALENNLGIQIARVEPQIQDLNVAQARAAWTPAFTSTLQRANADAPSTSFLSGGQAKTTDGRFGTTVGVEQALPWGGSYTIGWDAARSTTTNLFSNFSPQVRSSVSLHYEQPLMRNYGIDGIREQLLISQKNRDISDIDLRQTLAITSRTVRNAYWDLAYAIASLQVQQQSLDLAQESLRDTRSRVDIGTTPPIDIIEAEAEVATRQEAVIVAQAQIDTAEDTLRALIYEPRMPDFWTIRIAPTELPAFQPTAVSVDAVVRNALDRRTDLQQTRKTLEANDISIRYSKNQTLPEVTAIVDYGLIGLGGTQFLRGTGFPGPIIGQTDRGFGSVLGDLFRNDFPSWTISLNLHYPLGTSTQEATLARTRLQYSQAQTQLKNQELQVTTQVRNAARQVLTNQQRVQTTRVSRELGERRLDAEQKKFAAGTSTSFIVFQVQRDLAQARNNELRAVLDYNRSVVDLDTVQEAPITGATSTASATPSNQGSGTTTATASGITNIDAGAQPR